MRAGLKKGATSVARAEGGSRGGSVGSSPSDTNIRREQEKWIKPVGRSFWRRQCLKRGGGGLFSTQQQEEEILKQHFLSVVNFDRCEQPIEYGEERCDSSCFWWHIFLSSYIPGTTRGAFGKTAFQLSRPDQHSIEWESMEPWNKCRLGPPTLILEPNSFFVIFVIMVKLFRSRFRNRLLEK
jgi:hypothetical protein